MTVSIKKFFSIAICLAIMCTAFVMFTACDDKGGNSTYTDLSIRYGELVENNTEIFTSDGKIRVRYNSAQLDTAMSSNANFAKLSRSPYISGNATIDDTMTTKSLYEPALMASIMPVSVYIKTVDVKKQSISKGKAEETKKAYEAFVASLQTFLSDKHNIENRSVIDATGAIEQSLLSELCEDYYNLVKTANDFGTKFLNMYTKDVFKDYEHKDGERYAVGKMELYYITKMTHFATQDLNERIAYYSDKDGQDMKVSATEKMLNAYNKISGIDLWEGSTTELSDAEKECVSAFTNVLTYDKVFATAQAQYETAMQNVSLDKYYKYLAGGYQPSAFTAEEMIYLQKTSQYYSVNVKNLIDYINTLSNAIYEFKAA